MHTTERVNVHTHTQKSFFLASQPGKTDGHTYLVECTLQSLVLQFQVLNLLREPVNVWLQLRQATLEPLSLLLKRLSISSHFAPVSPQNKVVEKQVDYHCLGTLQLPQVEIDR